MQATLRYILLTALRDRLFVSLLAAIAAVAGLSVFLGGTVLVEQVQTSVVYFAGGARGLIALGLIIFISFHIRKSFENREIEVILTKPISRSAFIVATYAGFALLALLLIIPVWAVLAWLGVPDQTALLGWCASLAVEALLVAAAALFFALLLGSAVNAVLASLGFYLLGRMMAFFVLTSDTLAVKAGEWYDQLSGWIVKLIAVLMPRLDFFAQTDWLIYGLDASSQWPLGMMQAAAYIPLLLAASIFDFRRKQF